MPTYITPAAHATPIREPITMHRAASHRQYAAWSLRTDSAKAGLDPMTLVAGVSASIHDARITGNASGPFRLNKNEWARGGSRNHAATISAPFVTSAVGISHGGRTTRRYSLTTARRSGGTASISTSSPSRGADGSRRAAWILLPTGESQEYCTRIPVLRERFPLHGGAR